MTRRVDERRKAELQRRSASRAHLKWFYHEEVKRPVGSLADMRRGPTDRRALQRRQRRQLAPCC